MFTTCPECQTVFRLSVAELRLAEGYVRCGQCNAVFNAVSSLTDQAPDEASQETAAEAPAPEPVREELAGVLEPDVAEPETPEPEVEAFEVVESEAGAEDWSSMFTAEDLVDVADVVPADTHTLADPDPDAEDDDASPVFVIEEDPPPVIPATSAASAPEEFGPWAWEPLQEPLQEPAAEPLQEFTADEIRADGAEEFSVYAEAEARAGL
jgi:predicted Zn finger-like uncharacterized protein